MQAIALICSFVIFNVHLYGQSNEVIDHDHNSLKKKIGNTYWKPDTKDQKTSDFTSGKTITLSKGIEQGAFFFKKNGKLKVVLDYAFCGTTTWWEDIFSKKVIFQKDRNGYWNLKSINNTNELTIAIHNEEPIIAQITKIENDQMIILIQ